MGTTEWGVMLLVFVATAAVVVVVGQFSSGRPAKERARQILGDEASAKSPSKWIETLAHNTQTLARLSDSDAEADHSALRRRLMHAGIRTPAATTAYFGAKTLLALLLPLLVFTAQAFLPTPLQTKNLVIGLLGAAALGMYLPNVILARMVAVRQREIFESFPDALDLMMVCVEAGLGIEAALQRVAQDLQHRSRVLSAELQMVGLELRAGASRERALHNLALRTGVEEMEGFVSMVIQAERFGTSIAQALRVHADMLRTRRRQRAEETAAKIAVKLTLPLVFCIFPALLLVLMGPAMIRIYRVLLPGLGGD